MSFGMNSLLRPPTSSFTKRDLWCQSNGERLYSVLVEPRNARGARPAIVCAHAFGGSFRDTLDFAESMARAGYVAAAIDFRGGSSRSQSEGEVENASVATMTRDIESVVAEVRSLRSVDSDNVFVMGQGEGASAAMRVAASRGDAIRGLILCYPTFGLHDRMVKQFGHTDNVPTTINLWQIAGRDFGVDAVEFDPFEHMVAYQGPALVFHGDADKMAPMRYSEKAVDVLPNARLEVFPGACHGFNGVNERRVVEGALDLIKQAVTKDAYVAA